MNPVIARKGSSFAGAVQYITHDIGCDSAERVTYVETVNVRTNDAGKAAKVMAFTALHAADLKRAAGFPATGRKTVDPVYHFALTWESSQRPDAAEMAAAARSALARLGFGDHEAVLAIHDDKDHSHIHAVVNRIHPVTGKTVNPKDDYKLLQRWAWEYEKSHGRIYCIDRALVFEKDPAIRSQLKEQRTREQSNSQHVAAKSRPQWQAERDAPAPKSETAQTIRAELADQAKALHRQGREMTARHTDEKRALWNAYQTSKAELWAKQHVDHRSEAAATSRVDRAPLLTTRRAEKAAQSGRHRAEDAAMYAPFRDQERTAINRLFHAQRREFRDFLRTSHYAGYIGALSAAVQASRVMPGKDKGPMGLGARVAKFFAAALSADKRAAMFLEGQKSERETLRMQIRAAQKPRLAAARAALKERHASERQAMAASQLEVCQKREEEARLGPAFARPQSRARERHVQARDVLRALYVADKSSLLQRHAAERDAMQKAWASHNAARRSAWNSYRAQMTMRPHAASKDPERQSGLTARFADAGRNADGRRARPRTADAGRSKSPPRQNTCRLHRPRPFLTCGS